MGGPDNSGYGGRGSVWSGSRLTSVSHSIIGEKLNLTPEPLGVGASYQDDNMASGGYGYGDQGYDTAYDDEYPAAKPYPHPGTVTVRHLVN